MHSTLHIHCHKKMTAQETLEEIQYPIENLKHFLSAMTNMSPDHGMTPQQFTAIMNMIHYQVCEIDQAIQQSQS
ncbi:hypothetical protein [Acinetobacter sp. ANC 5502]